MLRLQPHIIIGMFTLLTTVLAGAAVARLLGLPAEEGAYFMLLALAAVGWLMSRRLFRKES